MNQNKIFVKEFCNTCAIAVKIEHVQENTESVDVDNLLILNSHCDRCVLDAGSGWHELIDHEELRKDDKLKDDEGFEWIITEIYNQKMIPAMFSIECADLMASTYIRVSDLCDYELVDCKHVWKDLKNGTYDQICELCGIKRMRAVISASTGTNAVASMLRETAYINFGHGPETIYKDEIEKMVSKQLDLGLLNSLKVGD